MGVHFRTDQHIEFAMLDTDQKRYLRGKTLILVMPILHIIDIIEDIALQVALVRELYLRARGHRIGGHTAPNADTYIEQEARRRIGLTGLQLIQESGTAAHTGTRPKVTLGGT